MRHAFVLIALIPLVANLLGSAVNIWYNVNIIGPRLAPGDARLFDRSIAVYNVAVYPLCLLLWYRLLAPLIRCWLHLRHGRPVAAPELTRGRRLAVQAAVRGSQICALGWLPAALLLPGSLALWGSVADPSVYVHIPVSLVVAGILSVTQTYLLIEYLAIWLLYPVFFRDASPTSVPEARRLSLGARLFIFTATVGVCPVASLVLLAFAAGGPAGGGHYRAMVAAVGAICILFGMVAAWLASRLLLQPVQHLTAMARRVTLGEYGARVGLQRADELGELIETFNSMAAGLEEKERVQETFGRYVSPEVARAALEHDPELGGTLQEITVLFVDIRDFTRRSATAGPQRVVALLNRILPVMVDPIERHGGIINKFLGDGLMAMFGAPAARAEHADDALAAALEMVEALAVLNQSLVAAGEAPVRIGVGIHRGPAVVGNVGTPHRMEYTAIGGTVNLAQRIEALNRDLGTTVLLSEAAWRGLRRSIDARAIPGRTVKGIEQPITVYRVDTAERL